MAALSSKCAFLKKPLETLVLAQTQRSLFVDYTLKCPVMSEMLKKNKVNSNGMLIYTNLDFRVESVRCSYLKGAYISSNANLTAGFPTCMTSAL